VGLKSCVPGSMIRNGAAAIVRATKNSPVLKGGKRGMGGPHHGTHEEQVPGNVPLEIGVGLALGIGAGIFVRNWTQVPSLAHLSPSCIDRCGVNRHN